MRALIASTFLAVAVIACASPLWAANARSAGGDPRLRAIASAFYTTEWRYAPESATAAGIHAYDRVVRSVSPGSFAEEFGRLRTVLAQLQSIAPASLSLDGQADQSLLEADIASRLYFEDAHQSWQTAPDYYVQLAASGIAAIAAHPFAPLSVRLADIVARERRIPAQLAQAEKNLIPSLTPAIAATAAENDALGAEHYVAVDVPAALGGTGTSRLRRAFASSTASASEAFAEYAAYVHATVEPQAHAPFAIGAEAFEYLESLQLAKYFPVTALRAAGEAAIANDRAAVIAAATAVDPDASPQAVVASLDVDHPAPDELIATAQADLETLAQFVKAKGIVDLPQAPAVRAVSTPEFERQFTVASMDAPGPLERASMAAFFDVTPVDPAAGGDAEAPLDPVNRYQMLDLSAYEVYPGRYSNYLFDRRDRLSLIRRLERNPAFEGGWAHYDEQLVVDAGLGDGDPRYRLAQLEDSLRRDCRLVAAIDEHTKGMTIDEATRFFVDTAYLGPGAAYQEAVRAALNPLEGADALGKLMLVKLRDDAQTKTGAAFSQRTFDDALLAHGDPPVLFARKMLLGPGDTGMLF